MDKEQFDKDKTIRYWLDSADDDYETMSVLYNNKRYTWSLFIGHLMIEKLLKAYYVQVKEEFPPFIHNLLRLAEMTNLSVSEEKKVKLVTITAFNIQARYDDYKMSFQKKCTPEFANEWFENLKEIRTWIREQIKL
ncbi:MAG: HEPN domain-containing protein [Ignavibacteriaceae bacterium]